MKSLKTLVIAAALSLGAVGAAQAQAPAAAPAAAPVATTTATPAPAAPDAAATTAAPAPADAAKAAAPAGDLRPVRLTNRLRNLVAGALATHQLVSDSVTDRLAAART